MVMVPNNIHIVMRINLVLVFVSPGRKLHANAEDDSDENLKFYIMIYILSSQYSFTN